MHWDGNNKKMEERNISRRDRRRRACSEHSRRAAHPSLDEPSMNRVAEWIMDLPPPKFPGVEDRPSKLARGTAVFAAHCASCHAKDGGKIGQVVPID